MIELFGVVVFKATVAAAVVLGVSGSVKGLRAAALAYLAVGKLKDREYPYGGGLGAPHCMVRIQEDAQDPVGQIIWLMGRKHDVLVPLRGLNLTLTVDNERERLKEVIMPCIDNPEDEGCALLLARWVNEFPRKSR